MQVDEPGAHRETVQLDAFCRLSVRKIADARDATVPNADVGPERLAARSVEDFTAIQNHVDHGLSLPGWHKTVPQARQPPATGHGTGEPCSRSPVELRADR